MNSHQTPYCSSVSMSTPVRGLAAARPNAHGALLGRSFNFKLAVLKLQ